MTISIPGRVVVFDYGDVISLPQLPHCVAELEATAASVGVAAEALWAGYHRHRDALDHGRLSIAQYWSAIGADCGVIFTPSQLATLWSADVRSWLGVNAETVTIIEELRAGGTHLALLSNAGFDFGAVFRQAPWAAAFADACFVSAELGLLKPDPAIYQHVADAIGVLPEQLIFIDNREVNVRGAESIGVTGHVFVGAAELRRFLERLAA